jgi:transposase
MSRRKREKRQSMRGAAAAASTPADGVREVGRFSARRKTETILRLLRGESLDSLARELGVTAATLAGWREAFLAGGQAALKSRLPDERDDEIQRLRAKVGEITMNNELLLDRCHRLEANLPLPRRRPSE